MSAAKHAPGHQIRRFDFARGAWMDWSNCTESDFLHFDGRRADAQVRRVDAPWCVESFMSSYRGPRYVVARQTEQGREYLNTPSGFPREFSSPDKARAAIAKATGSSA